MKLRLALFAGALLLLPALAVWLSGQGLPEQPAVAGNALLPAIIAAVALSAAALLLDAHTYRRSGSSLLRRQKAFAASLSVAGAGLCALLAYLNLYAASWITPASSALGSLLPAALLGAAAMPAVLVTRLWLAGFPGLLRNLARAPALLSFNPEPAASLLLLVAMIGLFGGAVWPAHLFWLLWLSPLLLLAALQLLWHESTIFSGLSQGDWSRVVLGGASGALAGGLALAAYTLAGGSIYFLVPAPAASIALGLAVFGLLCLQLGDVVAEQWRGRKRSEIFKRKPFPIQVVVKKD